MSSFRLDSEEGKRAAAEGRRRIPSDRRSLIAQKAAYARWYNRAGSDLDRVESSLNRLAHIAARAWDEKKDELCIRAITAMATYERLRIWIANSAGRPAGAALEIEGMEDAALKLASAKKRREQTLSGGQAETVIEESGDGASETK